MTKVFLCDQWIIFDILQVLFVYSVDLPFLWETWPMKKSYILLMYKMIKIVVHGTTLDRSLHYLKYLIALCVHKKFSCATLDVTLGYSLVHYLIWQYFENGISNVYIRSYENVVYKSTFICDMVKGILIQAFWSTVHSFPACT